ncbi:MAG: hypothetical protein KF716_13960 [Anaerolineae bacterium]|nr:hypothetical protein [Anaerolineae bacterium]
MERGTRILGAVTPLTEKIFAGSGASLDEAMKQYEQAIATAQSKLGEMYQTIFEDGMSLTLDRTHYKHHADIGSVS